MVDPFDPKKHIALHTLTSHLQQGNNNPGTQQPDTPRMRTNDDAVRYGDVSMRSTQDDNFTAINTNGLRDDPKNMARHSPTASSDSDDAVLLGAAESEPHDNSVIVNSSVVHSAVQDTNCKQQQSEETVDPVTDRIRIQAKDYENYLFHNSLNM